jgi:hypothetical protein
MEMRLLLMGWIMVGIKMVEEGRPLVNPKRGAVAGETEHIELLMGGNSFVLPSENGGVLLFSMMAEEQNDDEQASSCIIYCLTLLASIIHLL